MSKKNRKHESDTSQPDDSKQSDETKTPEEGREEDISAPVAPEDSKAFREDGVQVAGDTSAPEKSPPRRSIDAPKVDEGEGEDLGPVNEEIRDGVKDATKDMNDDAAYQQEMKGIIKSAGGQSKKDGAFSDSESWAKVRKFVEDTLKVDPENPNDPNNNNTIIADLKAQLTKDISDLEQLKEGSLSDQEGWKRIEKYATDKAETAENPDTYVRGHKRDRDGNITQRKTRGEQRGFDKVSQQFVSSQGTKERFLDGGTNRARTGNETDVDEPVGDQEEGAIAPRPLTMPGLVPEPVLWAPRNHPKAAPTMADGLEGVAPAVAPEPQRALRGIHTEPVHADRGSKHAIKLDLGRNVTDQVIEALKRHCKSSDTEYMITKHQLEEAKSTIAELIRQALESVRG